MKQPQKKMEKDFDAVKMMRDIRDQVSREIMNMTYEEEKAYLKKQLAKKPTKKSRVRTSTSPAA